MDLLYIVWDFNPTLLNIGGFEIRWYGLMWALAIMVGTWLFGFFARRENLPQTLVDSAFVYIVLGTIIGARVGHCLFYEPEYYLPAPWKIITEFRDGGLASHGATMAMMVAIFLCARKNRVHWLWIMDRIGVIACIGGALIRLGNLFNSEIVGSVTTCPWAFQFVRLYRNLPLEQIPAQHPAQLYEALCYLVLFGILMSLYMFTRAGNFRGFLSGATLLGIFLFRFCVEFIKVVQVDFEQEMTLDMGQWLSVPFIFIGALLIKYSLTHVSESPVIVGPKRNKKRG